MICATCGHAAPWKFGFVRCEFLKAWEYLSARCPCVFEPARWKKSTTAAKAARE